MWATKQGNPIPTKIVLQSKISPDAMKAFMASGEIFDCKTIFVGIGLPCLVAHITQNYTSPNCHLVFESGLMEVMCKTQPLSTASANIAKAFAIFALAVDKGCVLHITSISPDSNTR